MTNDTTPSEKTGSAASDPQGADERAQTEAGGAFLSGTPLPSAGGLFSAETFGITGLMLFAVTALNTRLLQLFGLFAVGRGSQGGLVENASAFSAEVMVAGGLSALSVLAGALSLFLGGPTTRAWSRWIAAATVIVGTLLLLASVLTYVSLPSKA